MTHTEINPHEMDPELAKYLELLDTQSGDALFSQLGISFDENDDPNKVGWMKHNIEEIKRGIAGLKRREKELDTIVPMKFKEGKQWLEWLNVLDELLQKYPFIDYRLENIVIKSIFNGFRFVEVPWEDGTKITAENYFTQEIVPKLDEPTQAKIAKVLGPEGLGFLG